MLTVSSLSACSQVNSGDGAAAESDSNGVEVGVLVIDDITTTRDRYEPLFKELSKAVGQPIQFVPLTQASQFNEVQDGGVNFVITNPLASVQLSQNYNTELLATLSRTGTGSEFGGVIIVKSDSAINSIADLKGKTGACVSMTTAAGGCLFQMYHLQTKGVDPYLDVASIQEIPSQNVIVQTVINGEVDFGFVRSGQLERMVSQGTIPSADAVKVLEPATDSYSLPHTTRLYPDWAVSATQDAPADLVNKMQQALLNLPSDSDALSNANIEQFVPAEDYGGVNELIETFDLK